MRGLKRDFGVIKVVKMMQTRWTRSYYQIHQIIHSSGNLFWGIRIYRRLLIGSRSLRWFWLIGFRGILLFLRCIFYEGNA
jgi:hypothetical protein